MSAAPDLHTTGDRVEALLRRFEGVLAPHDARATAEALVRLLTELYGGGLERALEIVHDTAAERSGAIFEALASDKLVASLMILHGLHPQTVEERVQGALDGVRPYLNSHEGDMTVVGIVDGVVHLRLTGSCHGCPSSLATVKLTVERAILEAAPEIREVRAQGVSANGHAERLDSEWIALDAHPDLARSGSTTLEAGGTPVFLASDGRLVHAFRNQCPRCFRSLTAAEFAWPRLVCGACGQSYDLSNAAHSSTPEGATPERFPVSIDVHEPQRIRLAIPLTA